MTENEKFIVSEKEVKKKKRRFTILDLSFVVIVLLCVLGIGFRTVIADWIVTSVPDEEVLISFKAEGISHEQAALLKEGERFTIDGEGYATLTSFASRPGEIVVEKTDDAGQMTLTIAEDPKTVIIEGTITVGGRYTDSGFVCLDDHNLYVGKILNIAASSYAITVIITEIPRK